MDFDSPMMMEEDPVTGGIKYGIRGEVIVQDEPGLGAEVDKHYLKNLVCKRIV
jgi:L-Ala-D/L-Glu epimerase